MDDLLRAKAAQINSPLYKGERLIVCCNPILAAKRPRTRQDLLTATERCFFRIANEVQRRKKKPLLKSEIGIKVGKIFNKYKVGKHFELTIEDGFFKWERKEESIEREASMDGMYIIRTSEKKEEMLAGDVVRNYKNLSQVEQVFKCMKSIDILVRPIRHWSENHVRAHIFLCMLSYYVKWHMTKALSCLLFNDEELNENRKTRDPVEKAESSISAKIKKKSKINSDGFVVHSFNTLLAELSTHCKNLCKINSTQDEIPFYKNTELTPLQTKAFQLLGLS
jgi:transposase